MKLPSTRRARPTLQMRRFPLTLVLPAAALLVAFAAMPLHAQDDDNGLLRRGPQRGRQAQQPSPSILPPTQPTSQPAPVPQQPLAAPQAQTPTILDTPAAHRARVLFAGGLLEIRADNSSLLQTLHDISRVTRMSITGGVADQRIFGDYGPASPATILATLLDGTGANMLLRQDPITGAPVELVLTQRAGGGNPVSPMGPGFDDSPFPPETVPVPPPATPPPTVSAAPNAALRPATNATPATPDTPGQPPGAVGAGSPTTPEIIYQKLLELQKARAAATAGAVHANPPAAPAAPKPK